MDLMFRPEAYKNIRRIGDMLDEITLSYMAQAYSGKIVYLLAETPVKSQRNLQDRVGAWRDLALRGLDVRVVPGDHRTIWKEPHIQVVAQELSACLDDAQKEIPLLPW
jgi:thioesterase domain-containing protein